MSNIQHAIPTQLTILGYDAEEEVERGLFQRTLVRAVVDVQELEDHVQSFLGAMGKIVGNLNQQVGKYSLDTITVSAEVNAKGGVSLLGIGGEIGGKGALSFTFKRTP